MSFYVLLTWFPVKVVVIKHRDTSRSLRFVSVRSPQDPCFCGSAVVCWNNFDFLSKSCYCKACQNFCSLSELEDLVNWRNINSNAQNVCGEQSRTTVLLANSCILNTCRIFSITAVSFPSSSWKSEICHRPGQPAPSMVPAGTGEELGVIAYHSSYFIPTF